MELLRNLDGRYLISQIYVEQILNLKMNICEKIGKHFVWGIILFVPRARSYSQFPCLCTQKTTKIENGMRADRRKILQIY